MVTKALSDEILYRYGGARQRLPWLLRRPLGFFFYITGACNLDCVYCWQREQEHSPGAFTDSSRKPMKPDEWVRLAQALPSPGLLGLSGGEATIAPAFLPLVAATRGRQWLTINTNATLFKDEHLAAMTEPHVRNVSISVDGFAPVHDKSRNGEGLFDTVCANISRLRQARGGRKTPAITIKTVLSDETLDDLPAFHRFCADELGASTLNISLQKGGDHRQFSLLHHPDRSVVMGGPAALFPYERKDEIVRVVGPMLEDRANRCRVVLYPRIRTGAALRSYLAGEGRRGYAPCHLPAAMVTVLPDGQVIPCLSVALGNVRDHGYRILDVLRQKPYDDFLCMLRGAGGQLPPACHVCCFAKVEDVR